jgi:hypothetical protein
VSASRWTARIVLLAGVLMIGGIAACGDDDEASTTTTEPSTTTTTTEATTTTAPTKTGQTPTLRPDGIGPVDFGTPADEGIAVLSGVLGPPDRETDIDPNRECLEGAAWEDCLSVVDTGRIVGWTAFGLEVAVTDSVVSNGTTETQVPLQVSAWRAVAPTQGQALVTAAGLEPGATVDALLDLHPEAEFAFNEGLYDSFYLDGIGGHLAWPSYGEYVKAIQQALNSQGAAIEVDGVIGPTTRTAWSEFCQAHSLGCGAADGWVGPVSEEERAALDFPPPTIRILDLHAG